MHPLTRLKRVDREHIEIFHTETEENGAIPPIPPNPTTGRRAPIPPIAEVSDGKQNFSRPFARMNRLYASLLPEFLRLTAPVKLQHHRGPNFYIHPP